MNLSVTAGTNALTTLFTLLNGGTLNLYTGIPPATVGTGLSGNTLIGTADFAATALSGSITSSGDTVVGSLAFTASTANIRQNQTAFNIFWNLFSFY